MSRSFFAGAAALLMMSSAALAADMSYPTKAAPVIVVPVFSWTGFYIGANAGYGWGDIDTTDNTLFATNGVFTGTPGTYYGDDRSNSIDGWQAGGQIGYNYQFHNNWVVGIEADFQWSGADANDSFLGSPVGPLYETSGSLEWFGTVRARLGYAWDRVLVYGTGGFAYGKVETQTTITNVYGPNDPNFGDFASGSDSSVLTGWTIGGGIEYALTDNVILRAEYLYVDLGSDTQTLYLGGQSGSYLATDISVTQNIVRAAVSYKF